MNALDILHRTDWAILTATREVLGDGKSLLNQHANYGLQAELIRLGVPFIRCTGFYKGVDQGASFLLLDTPRETAMRLAESWQQESVLLPSGLAFVQDGHTVPFDAPEPIVGAAALGTDFHTKLPTGEAFSFRLG